MITFSVLTDTFSIAFDEKDCLWKVKFSVFKIVEITLLNNPAFNFDDSQKLLL